MEPDLAEVAQRYQVAWTSGDVDRILAMHAQASTFQVHGTGRPAVRGHAALRDAFADVFVRYPRFGADVRRLLIGPRHWVLDWTLTFQPDGGDARGFHCLDLVEVDDAGLVTRKDTFIDHAEMVRALGNAA
jgi:hypothetical protein